MLQNLKLSSFSLILSILLGLIGIVISLSSYFVEKNIAVINETWMLYQTDFSQKARLEGSLQAALGFDGMIHNFKNYLLRKDEKYLEHTESSLGAAQSILVQYSALNLSAEESIAINDIKVVLNAYDRALHKATEMITQGYSVSKIDQLLRVNDETAIRALKALRYEVVSKNREQQLLSKSRIVADLRGAMGFDGMIHKFKNYIIRHAEKHDDLKDKVFVDEIRSAIKKAFDSISQYRQHELSEAEKLALHAIHLTLTKYADKLEPIHLLMDQKAAVVEIDHAVKVDDGMAVRGLAALDREINQQLQLRTEHVTDSIGKIKRAAQISQWSSLITIGIVILIAIALIRFYIIQPIHQLTKNMIRLAGNHLDTEITGHYQQNEIGKMARAVNVFKTNMIKRQEAEQALAKSNEDLYTQLEENKQLHQLSEEQTTKALLMSEHMVAVSERSEKAMAEAEKERLFVSSILNAVRDGIITIDDKGLIEAFNPGAEDIFGYKTYEVIGKNISMLMPEPERSAHDGYLEDFADGKSVRDQSQALEQIALRKNGETFPVEVTLNTIKIADEIKITGVVRDITERKQWEAKIEQLAMSDSLTGAANRNLYDSRLEEIFQHARRFNMQFALMYIDLDRFKPVNDTYGHAVGDTLLQKVVGVLNEACREVDLVVRLGGDEFVIIVNGIHEPEEVALLADRVIEQISTPFDIDNTKVQIGASIGISCYPGDSEDIETLKRMADEALYVSKEKGRNTYRYYNKNL